MKLINILSNYKITHEKATIVFLEILPMYTSVTVIMIKELISHFAFFQTTCRMIL